MPDRRKYLRSLWFKFVLAIGVTVGVFLGLLLIVKFVS
jgi:hypothetical protein